MKFHIITLGCKINQYESQAIAESLSARGFTYISSPEQAGTIIINSCAVTSRAVRDLKKICRKTGRANPRARIIITGCAAQVLENELSLLKEVNKVIPQQEKRALLTGLDPLAEDALDSPDFFISDYFRSRAVIKVQDGCTHRCTYCIVPLTRGKSVSRPPEIILEEITRLLTRGFNEITLGGINLRLYGRDLNPGMDFWDLIKFLQTNIPFESRPGLRIRLSSLEPSELNDKALETIAASSMLCPHLHISLQSGSPAVLEKMNRSHYNPLDLMDFSRKLKHIWPVFAMGADILAGFPEETEENFQKTTELVQDLPLSYAHVFPYSPRPDTPAASFADQVKDQEKKSRTRKLSALIQRKKQFFLHRLSNLERLNLVMENETKGMSEYYVECVLNQPVSARSKQLIQAKPLYVRDNKLIVEPVQTVKKQTGML